MKQSLTSAFLVLFLLISSSTFIRCNDNGESCQEAICTTVFVTVTVTITDQNQNPIVLDSYELINLENNTPITLSLSATELAQAAQNGVYPIMDDLSIGTNEQINIQFRGFLNNQQIVTGDYVVAKDCCHVSLISGDAEITL